MMTDIPALVKGLRQLLGLTQKQFSRELGVSCNTVNQWENARRQPQPARLQRLLEIKTSLSQGFSGCLTKNEAQAFKQRCAVVNAAERQELAATSVAQKFRQSEALLASAMHLGWTESPAEDEGEVWERWTKLRRIFYS